jgi:hypothetical protein
MNFIGGIGRIGNCGVQYCCCTRSLIIDGKFDPIPPGHKDEGAAMSDNKSVGLSELPYVMVETAEEVLTTIIDGFLPGN